MIHRLPLNDFEARIFQSFSYDILEPGKIPEKRRHRCPVPVHWMNNRTAL